MSANETQQLYWSDLVELRVHLYYLEAYRVRADRIDRWIKAFLAITSTGSIAAWTVWQQFGKVWGFLIALS